VQLQIHFVLLSRLDRFGTFVPDLFERLLNCHSVIVGGCVDILDVVLSRPDVASHCRRLEPGSLFVSTADNLNRVSHVDVVVIEDLNEFERSKNVERPVEAPALGLGIEV